MELIQTIVIEDEKYPRQYISIYKSRGKKIVVRTIIPHPPSEQALKNCASEIQEIVKKWGFEKYTTESKQ